MPRTQRVHLADAVRSLARDRAVLAVLAVVAVQTVVHLVNRATVSAPWLDVNAEGTPFAALSAVTIGAVAVAALLAAATGALRPLVALPLAGSVAVLSLDEWFRLHERVVWHVLRLLGLPGSWDSVVWPAVYLPLTASVALLLLLVARRAGGHGAVLLQVGLALLVAAVGLEVVSAPFSTEATADGLVHALEGALEEACELAGWGLLAVGVSRLAQAGRPPGRDGTSGSGSGSRGRPAATQPS